MQFFLTLIPPHSVIVVGNVVLVSRAQFFFSSSLRCHLFTVFGIQNSIHNHLISAGWCVNTEFEWYVHRLVCSSFQILSYRSFIRSRYSSHIYTFAECFFSSLLTLSNRIRCSMTRTRTHTDTRILRYIHTLHYNILHINLYCYYFIISTNTILEGCA